MKQVLLEKEAGSNPRYDACFQNCTLASAIIGDASNDCKVEGNSLVVRAWAQEVCFLCGLRFEPCGCSYDGHWRLTWSLTSGPVGLVEVRANWPGHQR
jgi:hypothetical protein